ncbi:MAG TPA: prepilin peptidase [Terracidiphilus sp.]|nr:prepilin peptidase [Terracidiphilus sp.]
METRILNLHAMRMYFTILAGLLGLAFGSFLNVCLSRWPAGESVVKPRSHCRSCGRTLAWWENVPLVSWVALRGRCRTCKTWIGWRYAAVELAVGGGWAFIAHRNLPADFIQIPTFMIGYQIFFGIGQMIFFWLLVFLAVLDAEHLWLPDRLTIPGIGLGALFQIVGAILIAFSPLHDVVTHADTLWYELRPALWKLLLGIAIPALLILLIRWSYWLVRRREGMGLGDAKLMAMLGAWLGLSGALLSFGFGILLGAVVGVVILLKAGRGKLGEGAAMKLPFGTFLCVGGIVSALWGQPLIDAYLRLIGF